ncbi:hypothetical protein UZ36_02230 [Candidatus Nitromaritima sp. SCGC AAA799-C22]|nr:hypothetical protein UZ36_02230 [Candidatus Nitromaritima sp. SCGC AAA799-C22]
MKKLVSIILVLLVIGASPVVSWAGEGKRSIKILSLINGFEDVDNQLKRELEIALERMGFDLKSQEFQYHLKFKILKLNKTNLITKVALFHRGSMVGAWEVDSWVSGLASIFGVAGLNNLIEQTTEEIVSNVKPFYSLVEQEYYVLEQKGASDKLARERKLLEEERKKLEALRLAEENRRRQAETEKEQSPSSGTGSGFFQGVKSTLNYKLRRVYVAIMSRPPRIEYPDAVYHVMNHGLNHNPIFFKNKDYEIFLDTLEDGGNALFEVSREIKTG